jgi:CheY-like chemotaxis protein
MNKALSGRRVLVVEDEMLVVMMIEDMLAELGCESVAAAATVAQAVALIGAQSFDVAMLDMNLSGNSSLAVAELLAACGIPFAFSTGNTGRDMWEGFGDRAVLRKPFMCKELGDVLARALASTDEAVSATKLDA